MPVIDEETVETTWREVANYDEYQATVGMARVGTHQEELLGFFTASLDKLSDDAVELGVYIFFVIFCMFEKTSKVQLEAISADKIMSAYERNEELLLRLEGAHDRFFERIAGLETEKQINVIRYVLETIMEAEEGEDPVYLSEEEVGLIYLTLKTAIDVLDQALNKASI